MGLFEQEKLVLSQENARNKPVVSGLASKVLKVSVSLCVYVFQKRKLHPKVLKLFTIVCKTWTVRRKACFIWKCSLYILHVFKIKSTIMNKIRISITKNLEELASMKSFKIVEERLWLLFIACILVMNHTTIFKYLPFQTCSQTKYLYSIIWIYFSSMNSYYIRFWTIKAASFSLYYRRFISHCSITWYRFICACICKWS